MAFGVVVPKFNNENLNLFAHDLIKKVESYSILLQAYVLEWYIHRDLWYKHFEKANSNTVH